jgi:hypothetical protein
MEIEESLTHSIVNNLQRPYQSALEGPILNENLPSRKASILRSEPKTSKQEVDKKQARLDESFKLSFYKKLKPVEQPFVSEIDHITVFKA